MLRQVTEESGGFVSLLEKLLVPWTDKETTAWQGYERAEDQRQKVWHGIGHFTSFEKRGGSRQMLKARLPDS